LTSCWLLLLLPPVRLHLKLTDSLPPPPLLLLLLLLLLRNHLQVSMLDDKVWQVLAELPAPEALAVDRLPAAAAAAAA
jgi:hypothetical protein